MAPGEEHRNVRVLPAAPRHFDKTVAQQQHQEGETPSVAGCYCQDLQLAPGNCKGEDDGGDSNGDDDGYGD